MTSAAKWVGLVAAGCATGVTTGCAAGASPPEGPQAQPMGLPQSPYIGETAALRERIRGTLVAWHRVGPRVEPFELDLRSGIRSVRAGAGPWTLSLLSEPDASGRVVFGVTEGSGADHRVGLDALSRRGDRQSLLRLQAPVQALARDIALSFDGRQLAYLRAPTPTGDDTATRRAGTPTVFELWTVNTDGVPAHRPALAAYRVPSGLLPAGLSWHPDGRHLAVVVQDPAESASRAPLAGQDAPNPQVLIWNTGHDQVQRLGPGRQVWVSTDGKSLLVRLDPPQAPGPAWAQRPTLLVRRPLDSSGAAGPAHPLPHRPAEITAVLGWLDDRHLVYRGDVSPGAPSGLTTGNSPLVGPKRLQAVKVMDTQTGEFLTVLEGVDPRSRIMVRSGLATSL